MNKRETVRAVSQTTGIEYEKCIVILDSFETVLTQELEGTGGVRRFFDRTFLLMDYLKNGQENNAKEAIMVEKVAWFSGSGFDECKKVMDAWIDILENKLEVSPSAKIKFETAYKLVDFFRNK